VSGRGRWTDPSARSLFEIYEYDDDVLGVVFYSYTVLDDVTCRIQIHHSITASTSGEFGDLPYDSKTAANEALTQRHNNGQSNSYILVSDPTVNSFSSHIIYCIYSKQNQ
jgi:hypothetical protein